MKLARNRIALVTLLAVLAAPASAHAIDFKVLGGFNHTKESLDIPNLAVDASANTAFVFGAGVDIGLIPLFSLEADALYENSSQDNTALGQTTTISAKAFNFPIQLRFHFLPFLSVGAGPYFRFASGDLTIKDKTTGIESSKTFAEQNTSTSDYGGVFSLGASIPLPFGFSVVGDARYYLGFKNLYTGPNTDTSYKYKGYQLLAGISFEL